jgi:DNA-binding CsgD family transcriptional regulator
MADRLKQIDDVLLRISWAKTPTDLRQVAFDYLSSFEATMYSYHHLPPPGTKDQGRIILETEGYPAELVRRYMDERLFLIDPMPIHAQKSTRPFRWSEVWKLTTLTPEQKAYMSGVDGNNNASDGYAFPVFGPGGRNGVFGLGYWTEPRTLRPATIREIHWVCQSLHLRYCELIEPEEPEFTGLSRREREVLEWVARGKSNADIATIMGVSSHTVDAYLRRIFLKLGTTDRVTAAIRAVGSGMLTGMV